MSEAMQRKVTMRPATRQMHTLMPINGTQKRRVAAYARVSTDSDEQLTSYKAQVEYYTEYIQSRADWQYVDVYTDEGITGTNTKKREGFKRMVQDALDGKIDLIVAKSISWFARNTLDSLTTVRRLKEKGVEVFFEKENLFTFDPKSEMMLSILSSLAQEESRSISENVRWGKRKQFADGKVTMAYGQFLGYEKGDGGVPRIVEKEAEVVRTIYSLFLGGKTPAGIAKHLMQAGIPSPAGKAVWQSTTVESILKNEKYKGDALLQKTFTVDFLTKKIKVNEGEIEQYYVEGSHPAIIDRETFERVEAEFERRKRLGGRYSGRSCLSSKIVCGDCGGIYGSKVWYSNTKYHRIIWRCNRKYENAERCRTPHVRDDAIKAAFMEVFNRVLADRGTIIASCRNAIAEVMDTTALE